jgi:hypothetical protein
MGSDIYRIWEGTAASETAVAGFSGETMAGVKAGAVLFLDESKG